MSKRTPWAEKKTVSFAGQFGQTVLPDNSGGQVYQTVLQVISAVYFDRKADRRMLRSAFPSFHPDSRTGQHDQEIFQNADI
ncbi:MAG: hypothetical protein Q4F43_06635 [Eubacteriales bacterium]|nr:hypothetical protein [Eubacteriales bacterium]